MALKSTALLIVAATGLAACVAPEEPAPPRVARSAVPPPIATPSDRFEAAPLPNRRIGAPNENQVVRLKPIGAP